MDISGNLNELNIVAHSRRSTEIRAPDFNATVIRLTIPFTAAQARH